MTVASYERDPAEPGECLFPVVPKIIASTTPATTTSTRPTTRLTPQNTRSRNDLQKPLDIPTSFMMRHALQLVNVRPGAGGRGHPSTLSRSSVTGAPGCGRNADQ
jgi:hypothetical protein